MKNKRPSIKNAANVLNGEDPLADRTEQSQRFIDAARKLGCDESEERFNEVIHKLASAPVTRSKPKRGLPPDEKKNRS